MIKEEYSKTVVTFLRGQKYDEKRFVEVLYEGCKVSFDNEEEIALFLQKNKKKTIKFERVSKESNGGSDYSGYPFPDITSMSLVKREIFTWNLKIKKVSVKAKISWDNGLGSFVLTNERVEEEVSLFPEEEISDKYLHSCHIDKMDDDSFSEKRVGGYLERSVEVNFFVPDMDEETMSIFRKNNCRVTAGKPKSRGEIGVRPFLSEKEMTQLSVWLTDGKLEPVPEFILWV